jgi:hypothetical protein
MKKLRRKELNEMYKNMKKEFSDNPDYIIKKLTLWDKILLYFHYCYRHKCWLERWGDGKYKCKGGETYYA